MTLPAVGVLGLLLGLALGGGSDDEDALTAEQAAAEAETDLRAVEAELDEANAELAELRERWEDEGVGLPPDGELVMELEDALAEAERERDAALDAARAEVEEERDALLADVEDEARARIDELEDRDEALAAREAELEQRAAELEERADQLDAAEDRQAATSFGDGVHVVGQDIEPGTYRTDGGGGTCYWARLSGLSGEFGDIIANGLPDGPASIEIRSSDVGFESSGCGSWTRVD